MSFLRDAIKAADPAPDKKKELTLAVNLLFELAEQKNALQKETLKEELRTAGTIENPSIPITNTLASHSETRAYVASNASTLVDTVTGAIKKFIDGGADNIVNGIGELVTGGLEAILGAGSGAQSQMHSYFIIVEGLSIVRFDIMAWQRRIEAVGITKEIENAMTFTAMKSSVDVDKITFNTFLQAYKKQLEKLNFSDSELLAFVKKSKEVFELLRDPSSKDEFMSAQVESSEASAPGFIKLIDAESPSKLNLASRVKGLGKRKTYSFRLTYDVTEKHTVKTDWTVYHKGHKHGVQPTEKEIAKQLIVLIGEVDEWCIEHNIPQIDPNEIRAGYGIETKSAKG